MNRLLLDQEAQTERLARIEAHFETSLAPSDTSKQQTGGSILPLHFSSRTDISTIRGEKQTMVSYTRSSTLRIRLHPNACGANCTCACHKVTHLKSPSAMQKALGLLFFGYRGMPALSGKCSGPPCRGNMTQNLNVDYYFPAWALNKAIRATYQAHAAAGPELCLRMVNVRDPRDDIFRSAAEGDIETVRKLLTDGKASVMDVDSTTGHSLLHVCRADCLYFGHLVN